MGRAHEVRAASMAKTAAMKSAKYAKWGKEIFWQPNLVFLILK